MKYFYSVVVIVFFLLVGCQPKQFSAQVVEVDIIGIYAPTGQESLGSLRGTVVSVVRAEDSPLVVNVGDEVILQTSDPKVYLLKQGERAKLSCFLPISFDPAYPTYSNCTNPLIIQ